MTTDNGNTPQPTHDDKGRAIAASFPTAGGLCLWYADGQLPVVRHVVKGQLSVNNHDRT